MRIVSTRSSARRDYTISGDEYFDGLIDFIDAHLSEISLASCDARLFFQKNPERIFYVRAPTPLERSGLYGTGVDVVIIKKSLDEFFLPTPFRLRPTERDFHNTDEFAARLIVSRFVSESDQQLAGKRHRTFFSSQSLGRKERRVD